MESWDALELVDLSLNCIIGTQPHERVQKQTVMLSLLLYGDFTQAGQEDCLEQAVDYAALHEAVTALVENSQFKLVEALAQAVARLCLEYSQVQAVEVAVEKLNALAGHGRARVRIFRSR